MYQYNYHKYQQEGGYFGKIVLKMGVFCFGDTGSPSADRTMLGFLVPLGFLFFLYEMWQKEVAVGGHRVRGKCEKKRCANIS